MTTVEHRRAPNGFNLVPPPGTPDVCLRGHHDDPEVMAAAMGALDDFARTLRLPGTAR